MRLALLLCLKDLEPAILDLERLLRRKALEFARVVKPGRSHLRDSGPITLGQEFNAFGASVERSLKRIKESANGLLEVNLGPLSASTTSDAQSKFSTRAIEKLIVYTTFKFRQGEDTLRLSQSMSDFVFVSSALRELAIELTKIGNDLRLLNSGPGSGFSEINIPSFETEQSHFPLGQGQKQNFPLLAESLNMVCFQVIGNDLSTVLASQAGQLQTNVMTPVIIQNMLQSIDLLRQVVFAFNQKSLAGITANLDRCKQNFEAGGGLISVLGEHIGIEVAQALLAEFAGDNRGALAALSDRQMVSPEVLDILTNSGFFNALILRPNSSA
jgi:aspartate ammonia-lyase